MNSIESDTGDRNTVQVYNLVKLLPASIVPCAEALETL